MTISGVSSQSAMQIQSLLNLDKQLTDLQRQLSTGQKTDTYAGLGLQSGLAMGLRTQLSTIQGYDTTISTVNTRLSLAQSALTQIDSSVQTVQGTARGSTFSIGATGQTIDQQSAFGQLEIIIDALNTQDGDQYLFSGKTPDQQPVTAASMLLDGDATHAGLKQLIAERNQADLGTTGLGRLQIGGAGAVASLAEDSVSPFGFKLAGVGTTIAGATLSQPSGSPPQEAIDLTAATPADGDTVTFNLNLPDGTSETLTLTATTSTTPGPNQFTIGADPAATAGNLRTALNTALTTLAGTSLAAASAIAAANNFFNADAADPPQRVAGPPFATATALVAGTSANTVTWYNGDAGTDPARQTATARVDPQISVSIGMRANEPALRSALANIATFAAMSFSASDPNAQGSYQALTQRLATNLTPQQGVQKISDIEAEIAGAQTAVAAASDRHQQTVKSVTDLLQSIQGVDDNEVGAQLLTLQTQLQASLQTTVLLAHMTLVDFLGTTG